MKALTLITLPTRVAYALRQCLKYIAGKLVYFLLGVLFPNCIRNKHKAVFGCYKNKFSDNSKYLYLHWHKTQLNRVIWISADKHLINRLNKQGMEAYPRWSALGVWHSLTAKYYFYCSYIGDINQYSAMGATKINLWHGTPLKKIEFDIDSGPMAKIYEQNKAGRGLESYLFGLANKYWKHLKYHQQYTRPDLMLSPSPLTDKLFASAFRIKPEQLLRSGNPRTDYYNLYPSERSTSVQDHRGVEAKLESYKKVILYAPSWRDNLLCAQGGAMDENSQNPYREAIDWQSLSQQLKEGNHLLLVRFHPNEAHLGAWLKQYPNIIDISQRDDVYDLLHSIDLLVTDYSSLFIDVLTLNIPIVFFQFDKLIYQEKCRQNYDYAKKLALLDEKITSSDALIHAVVSNSNFRSVSEAKEIYWGQRLNHSFSILQTTLNSRNTKHKTYKAGI